VFKFPKIILFSPLFFCLTLIFLAGCATPHRDEDQMPPNWQVTNSVPTTTALQTNQWVTPILQTNGLLPKIPNVFRTNSLPQKPAPIVTWTSLDRWAQENKLDSPRRLSASPMTTYSISSKNGVLVLEIGSLEATWNGEEIHLGFAPEMIDQQIFVHALDLRKNLAPLLENPPLKFSGTNRVIVLDPGHGGMNGGTISVLDSRPEKEFTLDLAKRLASLLETNGWQVFLTRTNDVDVSLSNRVAFAESHHANLFISLHFNSAAPDKKQSGLEIYCLTPTGMPSTLTRGYSDPWAEILPNNSFDTDNLRLAILLQKKLLRVSGEEDRGVRRARFLGVLRGQNRPAILIEGGFLSNPQEAQEIESADFRQKMAQAIADALK
jgi:N-acetylmuramoyl-L-alanine amidase